MPPRKAVPRLEPLGPLRRYPVEQAIQYLGTSRFSLYRDIKAGEIKIIKEGARTFIPASEIIRKSTVPASAT